MPSSGDRRRGRIDIGVHGSVQSVSELRVACFSNVAACVSASLSVAALFALQVSFGPAFRAPPG